ncbi:hypothetical protein HPB50_024677 [Hyalomma asiaticum]|uniref:Uncharacterized protein n=1 Tax=Hyalomma asiaticum TaxID=266040 RepID=A0ACB7SA42_HYAAI|nr:hypothetical protein HPB50_024677 [Hyalomma asiaticum]
MSHNSGDESGTASPEGAGAREGQRPERFGDLTPERRLQELQLEIERLSQMMNQNHGVGKTDGASGLGAMGSAEVFSGPDGRHFTLSLFGDLA